MDAGTEPPTNERGGATQAVASQRIQHIPADGEGGKEGRHNDGHPCPGLPMLPTEVCVALNNTFPARRGPSEIHFQQNFCQETMNCYG